MTVQLVPAVAIEAVALAALSSPLGIAVDHFRDTLIAAEEVRDVGGEIDQQVPAGADGLLLEADDHGLARRRGQGLANHSMRNEAALDHRPQQVVELTRFG